MRQMRSACTRRVQDGYRAEAKHVFLVKRGAARHIAHDDPAPTDIMQHAQGHAAAEGYLVFSAGPQVEHDSSSANSAYRFIYQ